ncbi:VaFE repeat-containing surface-anchored protein [Candidatus Saccharibacteria bacterium]|nr:VaFE repeat-containing surface-anchored protein [Candidatus Saccharibacteria bacterium]
MLLGCSVKKKLFKLFFGIILIATAAISIVVYMRNIESFAAGNTVTITHGNYTEYGDGGATYEYYVKRDGEKFDGVCVEPSKDQPNDEYSYKKAGDGLKYEAIKLLLYAYFNRGNSEPARDFFNQIFNTQNFTDSRLAFTHAVAGYIYTNHSDTKGLTGNAAAIRVLENVEGTLRDLVQEGNSKVWALAKRFQLYSLENQPSDVQNVMWIEDEHETIDLEIKKCDTVNTTCNPSGAASFDKVTFKVVYVGNEMIYDGKRGKFYGNGDVVADGIATKEGGVVTIEGLPPGQYKIIETGIGENNSLVFRPSEKTVNLSGETAKTVTFKNQIVRGDIAFVKQNDNGEPMANIPFKIKSTTTGEEHIVVTNENGIIDTKANLHSNNTNGYDSEQSNPSSITYKGYGTWFGFDGENLKDCDFHGNCTSDGYNASPVNDELGALPYDTYEITEIACEQNSACHDIDSQKKTFTISQDQLVIDLGTWENDCSKEEPTEYKLETVASDNEDGDKAVLAKLNASIKDHIEYCALEGKTYTIKGILMDKSTSKELLINGKPVENSITITPTEKCGTVEMIFNLDASDLNGKEIVVFESLYYEDELIKSHHDINDEAQTISVYLPAPETGLFTSKKNDTSDKSEGNVIVPAIIITIGGYGIHRAFARRKFFYKK